MTTLIEILKYLNKQSDFVHCVSGSTNSIRNILYPKKASKADLRSQLPIFSYSTEDLHSDTISLILFIALRSALSFKLK